MAAKLKKIQRVLITGASRGIGGAIAEELASAGYEIIAPSRSVLNLASPSSIDRYLSGLGPVDALVNNAGINLLNKIEDITESDWEQMIQVNLTAPRRLIQGVCPGMKKRRYGRIVNVSSVFSLVTKERRAAYSATKAALNGLTRTVAVELAPFGILVNALCPGYVATELTKKNNSPKDLEQIRKTIPAGRLAHPVEMARVVKFLVSPENSYLTGQTLVVDGGFSCR